MTGNEIREKFLQFFAERGHTIVESSPLVPQDDPTLLFTNAGMVQFKRVFMGEDKRNYVRAATSQRCVRAGGKHNDLENVGYTARHHTFFEMLGNFSFGDYFKKEAIEYAWEFLTKVLGLPPEKLWVSVYEDDDEAFALWEKIEELPKGRIIRLGEKDNFWAMGDTGPCGPCSEILIDQGPEVGCDTPDCKAGCDCDRYLELWNLVFMQYNKEDSGEMKPLPKPSIDTGMGLERITAVVQGVFSNYDSDLFAKVIDRIGRIAGKVYGEDDKIDTAMRVIADHGRATANLIADGVLPSNEGRGYVLRRVLRRAVRYGRTLGLNKPFLADVAATVVEDMAAAYPHLEESRKLLIQVVTKEEERFFETIDNGLAILHSEIKRINSSADEKVIPGDFVFKLYDTFGFPVDIVRDIAIEEGLAVDDAGFAAAMNIQRQQSKKSWKASGLEHLGQGAVDLAEQGMKVNFVGYETRRCHSTVLAMLDSAGEKITAGAAGDQVMIICQDTPFYAESGGQIGDQGEISGTAGRAEVINTISLAEGLTVQQAEIVEGEIRVEDPVELRVAEGRRQKIANNHTATHLLHAALRKFLGDHVKQAGSLVEPQRLRFDFTHFSPLTADEIARIETWVNDEIRANVQMCTDMIDRDEAKKKGATALFGEKYGDIVRVVSIGEISKELCGGTHVGATGEMGLFKILSETGIAAGVRRIEGVTGADAFALFQKMNHSMDELAAMLKTAPDEVHDKIGRLIDRQKKLEKEVSQLTAKLTISDLDNLIDNAEEVKGVRVITSRITLDNPKTLREIGDKVRDKMGKGVAVLGGDLEGKVALLAVVSKELTKKLHAGNIIKEISKIVGGSGGGRPDMAQAGGTMVDKLPEALAEVKAIVKKNLE